MRSKRMWWTAITLGLVATATLSLMIGRSAPVNASDAGLGLTPTPEPTNTPQPPDTPMPPEPTPTSKPSKPEPKPRLTIDKTASTSHVMPGGQVTFKIEVCNEGNAVAEDVVVSDALPPELELMNASASQGKVVVEGNGMRAELGSIWPGYCAQVTIVARVRDDLDPGDRIRNVASIDDLYTATEVIVAERPVLPETGHQVRPSAATWLTLCTILLVISLVWTSRTR